MVKNFFINAVSVINRAPTSDMLKALNDVNTFATGPCHQCVTCQRPVCDKR